MSGRYCLFSPMENIASHFGVPVPNFEYTPRYNIAPSQIIPVVIEENGDRMLESMRWGLIPPWADTITYGNRAANTRSDLVRDKPATRQPFKTRRCIIPIDGYYEWMVNEPTKQPLWFTLKSGDLMFIAGVWDEWKPPQGNLLRSFSVLTTEPNELVRPVHHRMPVILLPSYIHKWLGNGYPLEEYESVLKTYPAEEMKYKKVSKLLNDVSNDYPELLDENFTGFNIPQSDGSGILML